MLNVLEYAPNIDRSGRGLVTDELVAAARRAVYGTLYLPRGRYRFEPERLNVHGLRLVGDKVSAYVPAQPPSDWTWSHTELICEGSGDWALHANGSGVLEDLDLVAAGVGEPGDLLTVERGLNLHHAHGFRLSNVGIGGFAVGVRAFHTSPRVWHDVGTHLNTVGFGLYGCNGATLIGCFARGNQRAGFEIVGAEAGLYGVRQSGTCRLLGCSVEHNGEGKFPQIWVRGADEVELAGTYAEGPRGIAVTDGAHNVSIRRFRSSGEKEAVYLDRCMSVSIREISAAHSRELVVGPWTSQVHIERETCRMNSARASNAMSIVERHP